MNPKKTNNSKYTIDRKRNVCDILVEGNDSLDKVLERYNDILNDGEWRCGMNVIVDFTGVHSLRLSGQDLEILAYHHRRLSDRIGRGILCFITKKGYLYGSCRIFGFWAGKGGREVHVCQSKDEAMKILSHKD